MKVMWSRDHLEGILCGMSGKLFLTTRLKRSLFYPSSPKDRNDSFTFQMRYRYRLLPTSFRFLMKPSTDCFCMNKKMVIKYINSNVCSPSITLDFQEIIYVAKLHAVLWLFKKMLYLFVFLFLPFKNSKGTQNPLGLRSQELWNSVLSISASHLRCFDVRINVPLADYEAE